MKSIGRPLKPGISFYRKDAGHIQNSKVRLLFNEFDSDGYYIWCCLLDYAYGKWGYYFDTNNKDELELFASEYCKKKLTTIKEVIAGCIRRDLFSQIVYDSFGVLTCDKMQETYVIATSERRQKGSIFELQQDWLLLDFSDDVPMNIKIIPSKNIDIPRKKPLNQPKNSHIILENNKQEKTKEKKSVAPAEPAPTKFVDNKNEDKEPYWNDLVKVWFDFHEANKLDEPSFAKKDPRTFKELIRRLKKRAFAKKQDWTVDNSCKSLNYFLTLAFKDDWLRKHFLLDNLLNQFDAIYQRSIFEKQERSSSSNNVGTNKTDPNSFEEVISYLINRLQEKQLDERLIMPEYYDMLVVRGAIPVGFMNKQPGNALDDKKINAVLEFLKLQCDVDR